MSLPSFGFGLKWLGWNLAGLNGTLNVVFGREGRILDFMSALPQSRAQLLGVSLNVTNTEESGNFFWPSLVFIIRLLLLQAGLRLGQHIFLII